MEVGGPGPLICTLVWPGSGPRGPCLPQSLSHRRPQAMSSASLLPSSPVMQGDYLAARELDKAFVSFNGCTTPSLDRLYASPRGFDLLVCIHK